MSAPNAPLLSIVIYYVLPAPFLRETLDSVIAQDERVELVVVAGVASPADTAISPELAPHIDQLIAEPDGGAWDAANKGWRAAHGRWVQFLMSDDLMPPGAIARTLAALAESNADLATGNLTFFHDTPRGRRELRHAPAADLTLPRVLGDVCSPAVIYRRDLLERLGGFDGRYRYAHDRDLLLRAHFANARHARLAHDTCWMRHHADSRTLSGDRAVKVAYLRDHIAIAARLLSDVSSHSTVQTSALRRWQEEEAFKARILSRDPAATPLGPFAQAAAAWRIGTRKLWWTAAQALARLGRRSALD